MERLAANNRSIARAPARGWSCGVPTSSGNPPPRCRRWSAFRAASRARAAALARTRTPRTSSGNRTSATWPCLLRSTRRKTPHAASRRTASRVGHVERLIFCASHRNRKPQPSLSFQVAVPQKVHIHHVVDHPQPQLRHHHIFYLFPQRLRVDFSLRAVCFKRERRAAFLPSFS